MKTIKITFFSLLVLLIGTGIITSCSKGDETNKDVAQNAKVSSFLKSFYNQKTTQGASKDSKVKMTSSTTSKSEEFGDVVVTEILVGDDTRARGYVITSKESNVFLYFVDVDRIDYKMTTVDIEANQTEIFKDINQLDKYTATNEFDLIKVTQDLINENIKSESLSRIRYQNGACGNGFYGEYQAHYFLGIRVSAWTPVLDEDGHPVTHPC